MRTHTKGYKNATQKKNNTQTNRDQRTEKETVEVERLRRRQDVPRDRYRQPRMRVLTRTEGLQQQTDPLPKGLRWTLNCWTLNCTENCICTGTSTTDRKQEGQ